MKQLRIMSRHYTLPKKTKHTLNEKAAIQRTVFLRIFTVFLRIFLMKLLHRNFNSLFLRHTNDVLIFNTIQRKKRN